MAGLAATAALAQIATDGSVGPRQSFTGNGIAIPGSVGRWINGNLFHSFQTFNVLGGQTVSFLPTPVTVETPTLANIIARVTGGSPTTIQGRILSTAENVNLYLINPSGMVMGPGAVIDVNGSFYASTAHYLRSADGSKFESRGPGISLTFTTPDGFGFDSASVAPITIQNGMLRVREGATVGLVGGTISMDGAGQAASLRAPGGNAVIVGVASPGVVQHGASGTSLAGFGAMADVILRNGTTVDMSEGPGGTGGGSAYVRGGNVTIERAAIVGTSILGSGRGIDIAASGNLALSDARVLSTTVGSGNAGSIWLSGNNITLSNGALVDTSCDPGCTNGNGGLIHVRANDTFRVDGTAANTYLVSNSLGGGRTGEIDVGARSVVLDGAAFIQGIALGSGNATAIRIRAEEISLRGGAQVDASTRGSGQGGRVEIAGNGALRIEGSRQSLPSGIFANTEGFGNAGAIVISTRTLDVVGGGEISSAARRGSFGNAGSIAVSASQAIRVSGSDSTSRPSAITANTFAGGDAGSIALSAPTITIANEGRVQSQSEGSGRAGRITITGRDLELTERGQVSADARSAGAAGTIDARLTGTLHISGGNSGIFAKTYGPAPGGIITVEAANVFIENSGGIFAGTDGAGNGGRIDVRSAQPIRLETSGRITADSTSTGAPGTVTLSQGPPTDPNAPIITDGSVGNRQSFSGITVNIPPTVGRWINGNLFHSFQTFNVLGGQTVIFLPQPVTLQTPTLANIIARVTGGTPTTIQGTLRSAAQGVNLYLVNPSGMVIGFGALVDVNGSFYASTANALGFSNREVLETRASSVPATLTTPIAFLFDPAAAAPITIQGGIVRVREGATLGVIGGPIAVGHQSQGVTLQALGGNVILVGVASSGVVEHGTGGASLTGFGAMSDVRIQSGAIINVNESTGRTGGGSVYVRGGNVTIDRATITGRSAFANGRGLDIGATGDLLINASNVLATTVGAANAGSMRLAGNNITLSNGTLVDTSCDPGCTTGNGGFIQVRANDTLRIGGSAASTALVSNSFGGGRTGEIDIAARSLAMEGAAFVQGVGERAGDATAIRIRADDIQLTGGAQIDASARGTGRGGNITIDGNGVFRIDGSRRDPAQNNLITPSGIFANTQGTGDAGNIAISTRALEVLAGGEISSTARSGSTGRGGSIAVNASESIRISGADPGFKPSGIVTNTFTSANAGEITLSAPTIVISDEGKVQSQSEGAGRAGRITITGRDLELAGRGQISSDARSTGDAGAVDVRLTGLLRVSGGNSGIFAKTYGPAQGGSISIEAANVLLDRSGGIFATTDGAGNAGRVSVHATDGIRLESSARIASETTASGAAGNLDVRADRTVTLSGGSRISTSTSFGGEAGSVLVQAGQGVLVSGESASGQVRTAIASEALGAGRAGNVEVRSDGTIQVRDNARVTTSTRQSGDAGTVTLHGRGSVDVANGASVSSETAGAGQAGSVNVRSDALVSLAGNARVSTSTSGTGNAGTVTLVGAQGVNVGSLAGILSETSGEGRAGSVNVSSDRIVRVSDGGRVSTSTTAEGRAGTVTLRGRTGVEVASSGAIASETSGAGAGGAVEVLSDGTITIRDGGRVSTSASSGGDAGTVTLFGRELVNVTANGSIASESSGAGLAGNLDIRSAGALAITGGGRITTAATSSDGGNIRIESPQGFMDGGRITTAVGTGFGDGGNMEIRIPTLVMSASTISANAFGGDGGNIHIGTETFFKSANSSVTASSALGIDGTITLDSPAIDPAGQLLPPSPVFVDAGAILAGRCGARLAGRASSLVIVPRGDVPDDLHASFDRIIRDPWYTTNALTCEPSPRSF